MSYQKQNFSDGEVLQASHLNFIEDGIVYNEKQIEVINKSIETLTKDLKDLEEDFDIENITKELEVLKKKIEELENSEEPNEEIKKQIEEINNTIELIQKEVASNKESLQDKLSNQQVNKLINDKYKEIVELIPPEEIWRGSGAPPLDTQHILAIEQTKGIVYYKNSFGIWTALSSGGSSNNADFKVVNKSGWLAKTIAYGAECDVVLEWTSIEDEISTGNGTITIIVGGVVKSIYEEKQGEITINIDNYLILGDNEIIITVSDIYGNTRNIKFSISCVKVSIDSYFSSNTAYTGVIPFVYKPVGAIEKIVHFLIDEEEIDTQIVTISGRDQIFEIPTQVHGHHTFEVYFTGEIDGQFVESNHLYYDLICYEENNKTPIITCDYKTKTTKQFATIELKYIVYTPEVLSSEVTITDNFGYSTTRVVDRTLQSFSYKAENIGLTNITFKAGETERIISFETIENKINVSAEVNNLELYLSSKGRSNNDKNVDPLTWSYGNINAELTNFNLVNDCWQQEKGDTVLRLTGNARVSIPFNIFAKDFRTNGKTIEFEFATRDVLDYDEVILSCKSEKTGRGIEITAQKATMIFEGGEISTQYKEDEHVRISFTVEKRAENRLVTIYINGIMSGVIQYADEADFSQTDITEIKIGSNKCTTDIYCIRVYDNNLSQYQILDNWIADTQDIEKLIKKYERNNIFDKFGNVVISQLPATLPYLVLEAKNYAYLPQFKGDKERPINGRYVDPLNSKRSFTFNQAQIDVQGTSSQYYARKNYKIKFKNGFIVDGNTQSTYQLRETSVPTNVFTFKADVASSEGVNNVELCKLYDDACPAKTPPQKKDSKVRQGIEGYPILMFYYDGENYHLLGKYNFNNDKGTSEVFGFDDNDESWEILLNNTKLAKWKDIDFETSYTDEEDGKEKPVWTKTFEARHPEDNTNVTNLKALAEWLYSTDTTMVNTEQEKTERLEKFTNELSNWFNVDMLIFNYIFTELFLLVDNRAKNAFPTRFDEDEKWVILPYDYDTAIGANNEGKMQFSYQFEDTDFIRGKELITAEQAEEEGIDVENDNTIDYTYNGQDSVLYVNLRKCFSREIKAMYQKLRSQGILSYEEVERRFSEHQNVWGEAIFNEDARFKYIDPLVEEGNNTYLPMLQGSKAEQRKWWLYNRFRYLDSKYNTGDASKDCINLKAFALSDITLTPYADIYATAAFDGIIKQVRAFRGNTYTIENPADSAQGQVIAIYSAPQIAEIGDLSGMDLGLADFSKATKLSGILKIGDSEKENAKLTELTIGNLTLLSTIDATNCTALTQTVDVSGCTNIEHLYFDGSKIRSVTLPNGGILKTLHLPSTVETLSIRNQPLLVDFKMPSYEKLTTLRLEKLNINLFDTLAMVLQMPEDARIRVLGVDWTINTSDGIFEVFNRLNDYRGLDEYGTNVDKPQISGTIHTGSITGDDFETMERDYFYLYNNFIIDYDHITCKVKFYNYDGTLLHTAYVEDENDCYDPIVSSLIDTPTKPETDESKFIYSHWDKSLEKVLRNRNITALYDEYKKYYVSFIDDFGNAVQVDGQDTNVYYNQTDQDVNIFPNVVKLPNNLPNYSIIDNNGVTWDYHFEGWSLNGKDVIEVPTNVSGENYNIVYQAVFSEHRVYVVKFMNDSVIHGELHLYEGEKISIPETPKRVSTYQYDYEFAGWTLDGENVIDVAETVGTDDITYIAKYDAIDRYYDITFVDWDGTELAVYSIKHDEIPSYNEPEPTRTETAEFFYDFNGWSPDIVKVTEDTIYTAVYLETRRTYTVTWYNYDGTILETDENVPYGTIATYDGEPPTQQGNAEWSYVWIGWGIDIFVVTGKMDFTAQYEQQKNKYIVTWKNFDGTILETDEEVYYGTLPEYNGETPIKPGNAEFSYTFLNWDADVTDDIISGTSEVIGHIVYTAVFLEKKNKYAIKFFDWDGTILNPNDEPIEYGSVIIKPLDPTRIGYTFTGWSPVVADEVTGNAEYVAQYSINTYTIKFVGYTDFEGNKKEEFEYTLEYNSPVPQLSEITRVGYNFVGWDTEIPSTMPAYNMTITAIYEIQKFIITFVDYNDTEISSYEGAYGTNTIRPPDPTRTGYTFIGWSPNVATIVTGEATYTAQYSINQYTITFVGYTDFEGNNLKEIKITQDYNTLFIPPTAIARTGYNFTGWDKEIPSTIPAEDVIITAQYEIQKFTIKFINADGTELYSKEFEYGSMPSYNGVIPNKENYVVTSWKVKQDDIIQDTVYTTLPSVTGNTTYVAYGYSAILRLVDVGETDSTGTYIRQLQSVGYTELKTNWGFVYCYLHPFSTPEHDLTKATIQSVTLSATFSTETEDTTVSIMPCVSDNSLDNYETTLVSSQKKSSQKYEYTLDIEALQKSIQSSFDNTLNEVLMNINSSRRFGILLVVESPGKLFGTKYDAIATLTDIYVNVKYTIE